MSTAAEATAEAEAGDKPAGGGKKKLLLLAVPLLLAAVGAGLWFTGLLPGWLGLRHEKPATEAEAKAEAAKPVAPVYVDMPEIIVNLNVTPRRESFVKLKARLELAKPADQAAITAAMPRLLDLFNTYLREMRPEELRGSAGTYRLREELIARANIVAPPAQVIDVLFMEMLIQ